MKRILFKFSIVLAAQLMACSDDFFTKLPPGAASPSQFRDEKGIDYLLIGAYSILDGVGATDNGTATYYDNAEFYAGVAGTNWLFGDVRAGDAAKGSDDYDQASAGLIERHEIGTTSGQVWAIWRGRYDGVSRSNDVLRAIANADETVSDAVIALKSAEARFLRAHYYFELTKLFGQVSWIDENTTDYKVPNDENIWPMVEADLQFAMANLPDVQPQSGRASKGAATAYLAKAYMFQQKHAEAKPLLESIISSGRYELDPCFRFVFDMDHKNGKESIFAIQHIVNDGTPQSDNGNWGEALNHPQQVEATCCGFYQPSYDLVNAYQTDANGLPLLDGYADNEVKNDYYPNYVGSSDPFTPDTRNLDPRLDWTAGRRGIPYLDWGPMAGDLWVRNQSYGGAYLPIKRNYTSAQMGKGSTTAGWALGPNAANYDVIRYADVLLWAAEVEVEIGDLNRALGYVNEVRARAKNGCKVDTESANYVVEEYSSFPSQDYARKAVRFERRLELAMEGHRFFDLVRWGIASDVLNTYIAHEAPKRPLALENAVFVGGKHEYLPIPELEITNTSKDGVSVLTQNDGY